MTIVSYGEIMGVFSADQQALKYSNSVNFKMAGAECNTLIGLSKLGQDVSLITAVGNDAVGDAILHKLKAEGINLEYIKKLSNQQTGLMIKEQSIGNAINVDYFRKNSAFNHLEIKPFYKHMVESASTFYLTGITPALSKLAHENTLSLIDEAKKQNKLIVFDPNYRKKLWNQEDFLSFYKKIEDKIDVLLTGMSEAKILFGTNNIDKIIDKATKKGISTIIIKDGENGATFSNGEETFKQPIFSVKTVDAVGAGDAFAAGFLYGMKIHGLSNLRAIAPYAAAMGALATTSRSDYEALPTEKQLHDYINNDKEDVER